MCCARVVARFEVRQRVFVSPIRASCLLTLVSCTACGPCPQRGPLHAYGEERFRRRRVDTACTFDGHHHLRAMAHVPRQRECTAVELAGATHRGIGDPRLVRLSAGQLRKTDRENGCTGRGDDKLASRPADRNMTGRRVAEHTDRRTRMRQRSRGATPPTHRSPPQRRTRRLRTRRRRMRTCCAAGAGRRSAARPGPRRGSPPEAQAAAPAPRPRTRVRWRRPATPRARRGSGRTCGDAPRTVPARRAGAHRVRRAPRGCAGRRP